MSAFGVMTSGRFAVLAFIYGYRLSGEWLFAIRGSRYAVRYQLFAVRYSRYAVRYSRFAIRDTRFAIRYLLSVRALSASRLALLTGVLSLRILD